MASRRMVSLKIIDSAKFLKMPTTTQSLYFHLLIRADDDGVVEAFNVMRSTGANEDDLKLLVAKGYVIILNEDLVTFIKDWTEHNLIRADRKIDSMYKEILLKIVPGTKLIESRERADRRADTSKETSAKDMGRPWDVPGTANGPHRIGKDRIGKDRIVEEKDKSKNTYGEFSNIFLTQAEVDKLEARYGESQIEALTEKMSRYLMQTGKKYKSFYAALLNWADREKMKEVPQDEKCRHCGKVLTENICRNPSCPQYANKERQHEF